MKETEIVIVSILSLISTPSSLANLTNANFRGRTKYLQGQRREMHICQDKLHYLHKTDKTQPLSNISSDAEKQVNVRN